MSSFHLSGNQGQCELATYRFPRPQCLDLLNYYSHFALSFKNQYKHISNIILEAY